MIQILLIVIFLLISFVTMMLLYLLNTKKLSDDIDGDLNTLSKSLPKNNYIKRNEILNIDNQMMIMRNNLQKFNKKFYLNKKNKNKNELYKSRMLEIELIYIKIKFI